MAQPESPIVTVVIPSYNCAGYLPEAVESVLGQTSSQFSIIVVDDGSTDDTRSVVQPYLATGKVKYVYQENKGLPGARNTGARLAQTEFVAVLDADDRLAPTALEEMTVRMRISGASWCITDITKFWEDYEETQKCDMPPGDYLGSILRDDFIRRGMFFRRDALEKIGYWDESMRMREDWDLNIRFFAAGEPFVYLERPLYWYRRRPGSITTGNPEKLFAYTEKLLWKHHRALADAGDDQARILYATNMWKLARQHFYVRRDVRSAFRCAASSLQYDPSITRLLHPIVHSLRSRRMEPPATTA